MGLSPEQAAKQITATPTGHLVSLYDVKKGEIVRSDRWRPPDFRTLVKIAQTEQGQSEVSSVLEEREQHLLAKPMIFSDETGPTHFTFANQIGVQTDNDPSDGSVPEVAGAHNPEPSLAGQSGNLIWLYANLVSDVAHSNGNLILMAQPP